MKKKIFGCLLILSCVILLSSCGGAMNGSAGIKAYKKGDYEKALEKFEKGSSSIFGMDGVPYYYYYKTAEALGNDELKECILDTIFCRIRNDGFDKDSMIKAIGKDEFDRVLELGKEVNFSYEWRQVSANDSDIQDLLEDVDVCFKIFGSSKKLEIWMKVKKGGKWMLMNSGTLISDGYGYITRLPNQDYGGYIEGRISTNGGTRSMYDSSSFSSTTELSYTLDDGTRWEFKIK